MNWDLAIQTGPTELEILTVVEMSVSTIHSTSTSRVTETRTTELFNTVVRRSG
jgi:hypothetical protein